MAQRIQPGTRRSLSMAGSVLALLLAFLGVTLVYELEAYRSYLSLYQRRAVHSLAFYAGQILSRPVPDSEKAGQLAALAAETMKDPAVADVWFTDKDFRLLYSADMELLKSFRFQKLPVFYYPLYRDGFVPSPTGKGFRPVVNSTMDRRYLYIALPVKVQPASFFDYTVGIRIRKVSFLFSQEPLVVTPWFSFNPGVTVSWFVMFLLAAVIAWMIGRRSVGLYESSLLLLERFEAGLDAPPDAPSPAGSPGKQTDQFSDRLGAIKNRFMEHSKKAVDEAVRNARAVRDEEIRKGVANQLFPLPEESVKAMTYAASPAGPEGRTSAFTMVRQTTAMQSFFGIGFCPEKKPDVFASSAGLVHSAFDRIASGIPAAEALSSLNSRFRSAYLEGCPVMTGQFSLTDNVVVLSLAGVKGVLYHNARSGEAAVFPSCGFPPGKSAPEDFTVAFRQEKIRLESGDSLLVFNDAFLSAMTVETMKTVLSEAGQQTAVETAAKLKERFSGHAEAFFFLVKKT